MLVEHNPAPEFGEDMDTLDLVPIGADGSPHLSRLERQFRRSSRSEHQGLVQGAGQRYPAVEPG